MVDAVEEEPAIDMNRERALRSWATEAGLPEDSLHLQHWFGLSKDGDKSALNDALPRPSPWNMFVKESPAVATVGTGYGLRVWATDAGLAGESRFLSHWFGLVDAQTAAEEQLPRPSPWNYFANETKAHARSEDAGKHCYELRRWAWDAGLPEGSKFLRHWFGLANAGVGASADALPRPSPWNHFVQDESISENAQHKEVKEEVTMPRCERALRCWAADAGLPEESLHLQHWFGLSKSGDEGVMQGQLPRPSPWNMFVAEEKPKTTAGRADELRLWAQESGLSEGSLFLSHWFGVVGSSVSSQEQLPRPSPWNCFANETGCLTTESNTANRICYELRRWAWDAGLPEESQFLQHWFGLAGTMARSMLPRPSSWNRFAY